MKMKKIFLRVMVSALLMCLAIVPTIVKATDLPTPLYFGITALRTNSVPNRGYSIGNPEVNGTTGLAAPIWNIVKLSSLDSNDPTEINAYCVTAGIGFSDVKIAAAYDVSYDMRTQREEIKAQNSVLNKLATGINITKDGKTVNSYDALLTLTDLLYLYGESSETEKASLLQSAGINAEAYKPEAALSDDEIEAIQQAVIWYFTNYDEKVGEVQKYNKYDNTSWLWYTDDGKKYTNLADFIGGDFPPNEGIGKQKQEQAELLYKYLIDKTIENTADGKTSGISKLTLYASNKNNQEQPIVVIKKEPQEFDLALRKYITKIDGKTVADTRIPNIDTSTIKTEKTATYKHRKNPLVVETGSVVTYQLTVYNEGDIEGRATKIVDQLPTGLEFSKLVTTGYKAEYDKGTNRVLITRDADNTTNLTAYKEGTTLDSQTIELECKVTAVPDKTKSKVLTNVAWIDEEIDVNGRIITTQPGQDRDSTPKKAPDVSKDKIEDYKGTTTETDLSKSDTYYPGQEDDDDFEKLILNPNNDIFDLKLIKRITQLNNKNVPERLKSVDISKLASGEATTADYKMEKAPVAVKKGDIVTYTFRIYNEGDIDGYAEEISEEIPEGLEFIWSDKQGEELEKDTTLTEAEKEAINFNQNYLWEISSLDDANKAIKIKTQYLGKYRGQKPPAEGEDNRVEISENLIKAFDKTKDYTDTKTDKNPDYKEISVKLKVVAPNAMQGVIRNEAAITQDADKEGKPVEDRDSVPENWNKENSDKYYDDNKNWPVYKEDDEDYDNIILQEFDLALRKFITQIDDETVTSRVPQVNYDETNGKISYTHPKDPLDVATGDIVTYTIRVFNEGKQDGYAKEIMDDIPEGLKFLPENETNTKYRWKMYKEITENEEIKEEDKEKVIKRGQKQYIEVENEKEADVIVTDYLSKEQEANEGDNLLHAFQPSEDISETNPEYKDVLVAFEVVEPNTSDKIIVNSAQISEDSDANGDSVDDIDSKPGEWNEGEDDQDKEYIKLTYFDLALRKWVTQAIVIENGKETITQTGHTPEMDPEPVVKVELNRKNLKNVTVKFRYSIRVTNEGDIAGYAKEITDYIPEGLKFVQQDNPGWTDEGNNIISTRLLENTLLQPGEHADVEVLLTWINNEDNLALKTNTAEISEDYNDKDVPDRDSTPDNKKPGEDDIDDAPVILSISTGQVRIYFTLGFTILITVAVGIVLIKRFVL